MVLKPLGLLQGGFRFFTKEKGLHVLLLTLFSWSYLTQAALALEPIYGLDLSKYAGTWYEVAKSPNLFERKCKRNGVETYQLQANGTYLNHFWCDTKNGHISHVHAHIVAKNVKTSAILDVAFLKLFGHWLHWPGSGNYWVTGLDPDYQFSIVSHPNKRYVWILSRKQTLTEAQWVSIDTILKAQGYDLSKIQTVPQSQGIQDVRPLVNLKQ